MYIQVVYTCTRTCCVHSTSYSLDLDKWINDPPEDDDKKQDDINFFLGPSSSSKYEDTSPVIV